MTNENFDFLSQLESIGGVLSFENLALMEQIVIPNLQRIEGKELIPGINASLQVNVIEGDIIFPNLRRITRGDAVFNITNEVCGYLGINWTVILADGSLIDDSNCSSKYRSIHTASKHTTILLSLAWYLPITN